MQQSLWCQASFLLCRRIRWRISEESILCEEKVCPMQQETILLPHFAETVQYHRGVPVALTLRPIITEGSSIPDAMTPALLAGLFRQRGGDLIRRYGGSPNTTGLFQAWEVDGIAHRAWDHPIRLVAITEELISTILEEIRDSNEDDPLMFQRIEWSFFFTPGEFNVVAARQVTRPSWTGQKYALSWKGHDRAGCVAVAFTVRTWKGGELRYGKNVRLMLEEAWELQNKVWGGRFSIPVGEVVKYVSFFPDWRVVVLDPRMLKKRAPFVGIGERWVFADGKKTVYLVWDYEQEHMAVTGSPGEIYHRITKQNGTFCGRCLYVYTQHMEHSHEVDGEDVFIPKKRKIAPCRHCGERKSNDVTEKHVCHSFSCMTCSGVVRKDSGQQHRCILFAKAKKPEKHAFLESGEEADGSKTALVTYDFESMMMVEETSGVNVRLVYDLDEEGRYVTDEVGCVIVTREATRDRHQVNFVVAKWAGGTFIFEGEEALREFILWSISFNFGNNILIAHNSSGYDACLILNEVYSQYLDCNVAPVMKGQKIMQLKLSGNPLGHTKHYPSTIFRDSMLHIPGSLASLAKEQCGDMLRKGYFPHGFNTPENQNYVG